MVEINRESSEIVIKEVFSFNNHVFPKIEEIKQDLIFKIENNELSEDVIADVQSFVDHEINKDDEFAILDLIKDSYEQDINYFDNASIFDDFRIDKCINDWIEGDFDFNPEDLV